MVCFRRLESVSASGRQDTCSSFPEDLQNFVCRTVKEGMGSVMALTSAQLKTAVSPAQDQVTDYFQSAASYWRDIYYDQRLQPTIYRDRQNVALRWIRKLHLPLNARILEIG